jgi:cysteine-rich repeat protein
MAPGVGFGITVIDSAKAHIHYNMISRTALSGIVVDLAQWAQVSDYSTANLEVGCNHFDGLAKYDIVIQNTAQFTVRGDDMSLGNQAPGYGERFPVARRRAGDRRCGDGAVDEGEGCDDGNRIDTDACTNHCQPARCGDAIVRTDHNANDPAHEACDFGADNLLCVACSIVRSNRLALGADHACALRNGMVYCWGSNADQQLGMRGTNDCVDQGNCSAHALVTEFSNAIGVVAGEHHSCAYNDEQMRCFGRSLHGALMGSSRQGASFTTRFRIAPTLLAAGGSATCYRIGTGVTKCAGRLHPNGSEIIDPAAMFENANLNDLRLGPSHYCWRNTEGISCTGSNQDGAISDNSASHAEGVNIDPRHDVQVAVGDRITCIIDAAQNLACRGSDRGGRLGRGGDGHCERRRNCAATMAPVHNLGGVVQVALGSHHTCALDHRGRVTCWGQNLTASQGIDGEEFQTTPGDPVPLPAPAAEVRAGRFHSCAFSIDERVFCWGSNNLGQVGNGVLSGTEPPTEVQFSE